MGGSKRMRKRLRKLWREDPACRCCGCATVLPEMVWKRREDRVVFPNGIPGNMATIQHEDDRFSPHRGSAVYGEEERTTLFCWACNNLEGALSQAMQPIEELHRRAKNGHRS